MPRQPPATHIQLSIDNRLTLPKHFCDRIPWIAGKSIDAWLLLVEPGRYRLLSDEEVQNDPQLEPLRLLILQQDPTTPNPPSYAKQSRDAAMIARLTPITIDPHKGSWRILFAEELAALAPPNCNPKTLSILMPEGYLEIWYADVLRRALDPSWHHPR